VSKARVVRAMGAIVIVAVLMIAGNGLAYAARRSHPSGPKGKNWAASSQDLHRGGKPKPIGKFKVRETSTLVPETMDPIRKSPFVSPDDLVPELHDVPPQPDNVVTP